MFGLISYQSSFLWIYVFLLWKVCISVHCQTWSALGGNMSVTWIMCLHGLRASVTGLGVIALRGIVGELTWVAFERELFGSGIRVGVWCRLHVLLGNVGNVLV